VLFIGTASYHRPMPSRWVSMLLRQPVCEYQERWLKARAQLQQEVARLGGNYAHVLNESVDSRHNDVTGENWLHGCFTYMLYRQPNK